MKMIFRIEIIKKCYVTLNICTSSYVMKLQEAPSVSLIIRYFIFSKCFDCAVVYAFSILNLC